MSKKIKKSGVEEPVNGMITGDYKIGDETYRGSSRADIDEFFNGQDISEEEKKNSGDALEELLKNSKYDLADALKKFVSFGKGFLSTLDPHGDVYKKLESALKSGNSDIVKAVEAFEAHNRDLERQLAETQEALRKEKAKKKFPGIFRQPEHLVNFMIKGSKQIDSDLFSMLEDQIGSYNQIEGNENRQISKDLEGVNSLSAHEWKLMDAFCVLMGTLSHNTEQQDDPSFYIGNAPLKMASVGQRAEEVNIPGLEFTTVQLARVLNGGKEPGGKDVATAFKSLVELAKRNFVIKHTDQTTKKGPKGTEVVTSFEQIDFEPMIKIITRKKTEQVKGEKEPKSVKHEVSIRLSFLFSRQIASYYLNTPVDLIGRTIDAWGGGEIPAALATFRDMLRLWHKHSTYSPEMNVINLYSQLYPSWVKTRQIKRIKEEMNKLFDACKSMGLLDSFEIVDGKAGQKKYIFHIRKEWPKSLNSTYLE